MPIGEYAVFDQHELGFFRPDLMECPADQQTADDDVLRVDQLHRHRGEAVLCGTVADQIQILENQIGHVDDPEAIRQRTAEAGAEPDFFALGAADGNRTFLRARNRHVDRLSIRPAADGQRVARLEL